MAGQLTEFVDVALGPAGLVVAPRVREGVVSYRAILDDARRLILLSRVRVHVVTYGGRSNVVVGAPSVWTDC
jgi:hypothetical protein